MPRLLVVALVALLLAGCGKSDDDEIRATVEGIGNAEADGDWGAVCDLMTPELQKLVVGASQGAKTCPDALKAAAATMSSEEKDKLRQTQVVSITITGDTARAKVEPAGEFADSQPLRKVDGKWLLDRER